MQNVTFLNTTVDDEIPDSPPTYDSAQNGIVPILELLKVFQYSDLIFQLVRRDVVARYKRSVLGVAWTMLNPLGIMIVLTVVFSQVFKQVASYPVYVLSGYVAWVFFTQTTTAAISTLVWGGEFFQRIYVPRSIFAISAIGTGLVNLFLSLVPLLVVMIFTQFPISPSIILVPIPIILLACFSLGIGLIISSIAIYFPDVVEMYQIILTAWLYITPIMYPLDVLQGPVLKLVSLNPMVPLMNVFRMPIYDGKVPGGSELLPAMIIAFVTLGIGWWIFTRKSDEFAYRT